jgi:hypothetical protein
VTDPYNIDASEITDEMARDPLSNALFRNAQLTVLVRRLSARIDELERQNQEE